MSNYYYEMCAVHSFLVYVYQMSAVERATTCSDETSICFCFGFFSIYFRKIIRIVFYLIDVQKVNQTGKNLEM